jgi:hypothetical protein
MKKINSLPVIVAILAGVSLLVVFLVMQPAWFKVFNLSSERASNIGSALGGIVGPVVSMYSAYLLYEALTAQQESLNDQRKKASADTVILLMNQLQQEIEKFTLVSRTLRNGKETDVREVFGSAALFKYASGIGMSQVEQAYDSFTSDTRSDDILSFIRTFILIERYMSMANLDFHFYTLLCHQMDMLYLTKLKSPLRILANRFEEIDEYVPNEIKKFYHDHEKA